MVDKKYLELMNREVDDLITPSEKQDLHQYLSENREASEYYDELLSADNALKQISEPEVPANLNKRIINSIDFTRYMGKPDKRKTFNFIRGSNLRYALTFATGLLAGILIFTIFTNTPANFSRNDISGTIGIEKAVTLKEIPILISDIEGNISLKEKNDLYLLEISLNSNSLVDLTISYPDQVKLDSFKPGVPGRINLITAGNFIKAANAGPQQYTFSFTDTGLNPPPVNIELSRSGKKLFEYEFALTR